jgi:hypothetical protein
MKQNFLREISLDPVSCTNALFLAIPSAESLLPKSAKLLPVFWEWLGAS